MPAEKSRYYYETLMRQGKSRRNLAVGLVVFYGALTILLFLLDLSGASRGLGPIGAISFLIVGAISLYHYSKACKDLDEARSGLHSLPSERRGE